MSTVGARGGEEPVTSHEAWADTLRHTLAAEITRLWVPSIIQIEQAATGEKYDHYVQEPNPRLRGMHDLSFFAKHVASYQDDAPALLIVRRERFGSRRLAAVVASAGRTVLLQPEPQTEAPGNKPTYTVSVCEGPGDLHAPTTKSKIRVYRGVEFRVLDLETLTPRYLDESYRYGPLHGVRPEATGVLGSDEFDQSGIDLGAQFASSLVGLTRSPLMAHVIQRGLQQPPA